MTCDTDLAQELRLVAGLELLHCIEYGQLSWDTVQGPPVHAAWLQAIGAVREAAGVDQKLAGNLGVA